MFDLAKEISIARATATASSSSTSTSPVPHHMLSSVASSSPKFENRPASSNEDLAWNIRRAQNSARDKIRYADEEVHSLRSAGGWGGSLSQRESQTINSQIQSPLLSPISPANNEAIARSPKSKVPRQTWNSKSMLNPALKSRQHSTSVRRENINQHESRPDSSSSSSLVSSRIISEAELLDPSLKSLDDRLLRLKREKEKLKGKLALVGAAASSVDNDTTKTKGSL